MYLDTCHFWFVFIIDYQSLLPQTIVVSFCCLYCCFRTTSFNSSNNITINIFFFHIPHPTNKLQLKTFKSGFQKWTEKCARNCITMLLCSPDAWAKSMLVTRHPKLYSVLYSLFHLPVPLSKYVLFYRAMNWGKTFFFFLLLFSFSLNNLFSFDFSHFLATFFYNIFFTSCGAFILSPFSTTLKHFNFLIFFSLCLLYFLFVSIKDSCDFIVKSVLVYELKRNEKVFLALGLAFNFLPFLLFCVFSFFLLVYSFILFLYVNPVKIAVLRSR